MSAHLRWLATIAYRTEISPTQVDYAFEELQELHDLVERGPDWNCIVSINVRLNPERRSYPNDTIEKAAERRG